MLNQQKGQNSCLNGKASKPLDIIGFVTRYGLLALIIGSFLFSTMVPVVLLIGKPDYEASARLKIDPVVPSLMTKSEDPSIINYFHDYARTQAMRLKDFEILAETINRLTPEEREAILPPGIGIENSVAILERMIRINTLSFTHLLELRISGKNAEGLAELLNRLMDVFLEKVRSEAEMKDKERLDYLNQKRKDLSSAISDMEFRLKSLAETIHTASFSEDFNVLQQKSQELQKLAVQAFGARVIAEEDYNQTLIKADKVKALNLDPMVEEIVMDDQSIDFTSSWTYQQLQQMRGSIDGATKQNPDRILVEQRMQAMRDYEDELRGEVQAAASKILHGKRDLELETESIESYKKLQAALQAEASIVEAVAKNQQDAGLISQGLIEGESLSQQLKHTRELLFRIDTRIHELKAEGKAPLRISIESKARRPISPTGSNTKKLLLVCLVGAFGLAGTGLLAYDFFDNRIRNPKNITEAVGYPPTWPISKAPADVQFDQLLGTAPNSQPAMAIRSLAIRLNREREETQSQVFLFTGVERGTGCSGITINCARALSDLAPRILLLDGSLDSSRPVPVEDRETARAGLSDFLVDQKPLEECIVKDHESGLDYMPAGTRGLDKASRRKLPAFINLVRAQYDAICIDTNPVLKCDLTEYLAIQADAIVLISQGDSTFYRDLRRATEILVRLGVPAIAPVLNWGGEKKNDTIDQVLAFLSNFLEKAGRRYGIIYSKGKNNGSE